MSDAKRAHEGTLDRRTAPMWSKAAKLTWAKIVGKDRRRLKRELRKLGEAEYRWRRANG